MNIQSDRISTTRRQAQRALAGAVSLIFAIVLVACSAPAKTSASSNPASNAPTTAVDPGTGPTTITQSMRSFEVAGGFDDATNLVSRPMRNQLWVTQRSGAVRAIEIETSWSLELGQTQRSGFKAYPSPLLDISSEISTQGERGLLGIAFSTDARTLFLSYVDKRGELVVASWSVTDPIPPPITVPPPATTSTVPGTPSSSPTSTTLPPTTTTTTNPLLPVLPEPVIEPGSKRIILTIARDGDTNYSGQLMLGRDGFLYIGVGDSPSGQAEKTAQNPESLLGKVLRIDPGGATFAEPYVIPPGNPFATGGGAPQIWITGAQNPLRFSFDRANGNMWVTDAGRLKFGEIDYLPASQGAGQGDNLGWPFKDGKEAGPTPDGAPSSLISPLVVSPSSGPGCPLIGGFVYRGSVTNLQGIYIYGDHCTGTVRGLLQRRGVVFEDKAIGPQLGANSIIAFTEDNQGELYLVTTGGSVQRLAAA